MTALGKQGRLAFGQPSGDEGTVPVKDALSTDGTPPTDPAGGGPRVVRVQPDVVAIDREFDYLVPPAWSDDGRADSLGVGSRVRIQLGGRRVGGWVVADHVEPPVGVNLRPLAKLSGLGPEAEIIELARWAAHRWVGRLAGFLATASPPTVVAAPGPPPSARPVPEVAQSWAARAFTSDRTVLRLPPSVDPSPVAVEAARLGDALVLVPSTDRARLLAVRLRRAGLPVALLPRDWAAAAAGGLVVGSRGAAFGPVGDLAAVLVVDEHDEAYQEERSPTWHARDVAIERARRAGVPCLLTSPSPSLEALAWGDLLVPSRAEERAGWPVVDLVDRRSDDPTRAGLFSDALVSVLRTDGDGPVVCVLNRRGRSRLLACDGCGALARCEEHRVPLAQDGDGMLACRVSGDRRPVVCHACGSTRFRNLRAGVTRVREELEALAGRPVIEVTGGTDPGKLPDAGVYVGTEAVLHRIERASRVVFLEFDQELLAPRFRAAEQAMTLLVRAARLLGPRSNGGRLVVQTRQSDHEVLQAALHADPGRLAGPESERRRLLALPPHTALARVSGAVAGEFVDRLGCPEGIDVLGPRDGAWLVRAADHDRLADALAEVERPRGRLHLQVDPSRV